jgi:menaquinol-cytochrome c reductase iron-sulfur subunit
MLTTSNQPGELPRRPFLKKTLALILGVGAFLPAMTAGVLTFLHPLRRGAGSGTMIRVAPLSALPEDGLPRRFAVWSSRRNAWTRSPHEPLGAVFLRRTGPDAVEALHAVCPHAGCQVVFVSESRDFQCPCHKSAFDLAGRIAQANSPSPRDMDTLELEVRDQDVWVRFQNFRPGSARKIPV